MVERKLRLKSYNLVWALLSVVPWSVFLWVEGWGNTPAIVVCFGACALVFLTILIDSSATGKKALQALQRHVPDFHVSHTLQVEDPKGFSYDYPLVLALDADNRVVANFTFTTKRKAIAQLFSMKELSSFVVVEDVINIGTQAVDGDFNPTKALEDAARIGIVGGIALGRDFQRVKAKGIREIELQVTEKTSGKSHRLCLFEAGSAKWAFTDEARKRALALERAVEFAEELEHAWGHPCLHISFAMSFSLPKYDYNRPSCD